MRFMLPVGTWNVESVSMFKDMSAFLVKYHLASVQIDTVHI